MTISICNTYTVLAFSASGSNFFGCILGFYQGLKKHAYKCQETDDCLNFCFVYCNVEQEVCFKNFHNINRLTFSWETLNEQSVETVFSVISDSKSFSSIFLIDVVNLRSPSNILLF